MKFSDENKAVKEFDSNYFSFGVHKVQILLIEEGEYDGKAYLDFTIGDPDDGEKTDVARMWFSTDQAINYSFNTLRTIYVHNAPEDKKDAARDTIDGVADLEELVKVVSEKLIGGECWFTKYYSDTRTYTNKAGATKKSVEKNIYGYEPKLKPELMPAQADENGDAVVNLDNANEVFLGNKKVSGGIPSSW